MRDSVVDPCLRLAIHLMMYNITSAVSQTDRFWVVVTASVAQGVGGHGGNDRKGGRLSFAVERVGTR